MFKSPDSSKKAGRAWQASWPWLALVGLFGTIGSLGFLAASMIQQKPYRADCAAQQNVAYQPAVAVAAVQVAAAAPADDTPQAPSLQPDQSTDIRFGRREGAKATTVTVSNPDGRAVSARVLDDFLREDGAAFATSRGSITAGITNIDDSGKLLALTICADRSAAGADPGSYKGSVVLNSTAGAVTIPVVMKLSDTHVPVVLPAYLAATLVFGSLYSWALRRNIGAEERVVNTSNVRLYLRWWTTLGGIVSVVAGMTAAFGIFNAQYLSADVWGSQLQDVFGLAAAMFVAFIGAATVAHLPGGGGSRPKEESRSGGSAADAGKTAEDTVETKPTEPPAEPVLAPA
jgi:hypothetical protein